MVVSALPPRVPVAAIMRDGSRELRAESGSSARIRGARCNVRSSAPRVVRFSCSAVAILEDGTAVPWRWKVRADRLPSRTFPSGRCPTVWGLGYGFAGQSFMRVRGAGWCLLFITNRPGE